jgi:hypothetical protein
MENLGYLQCGKAIKLIHQLNRCWFLDAGFWMPDAGCLMLDAGFRILIGDKEISQFSGDACSGITDTESLLPNVERDAGLQSAAVIFVRIFWRSHF